MSTICIGGVCVPYSAVIPLVLFGIKWLLEKLFVVFGIQWPSQKQSLSPSKNQSVKDSEIQQSCCRGGGVISDPSSVSSSKTIDATSSSTSSNGTTTTTVRKVQNRQEWDELLRHNEWVVCKFTAVWCKPCQAIQPFFEQQQRDVYCAAAVFCVVDVDDLDDVASQYQVALMPTFVVFHHEIVVGKMTGSSEAQLQSFLQQHLSHKK